MSIVIRTLIPFSLWRTWIESINIRPRGRIDKEGRSHARERKGQCRCGQLIITRLQSALTFYGLSTIVRARYRTYFSVCMAERSFACAALSKGNFIDVLLPLHKGTYPEVLAMYYFGDRRFYSEEGAMGHYRYELTFKLFSPGLLALLFI